MTSTPRSGMGTHQSRPKVIHQGESVPKTKADLRKIFPLRPIESEADYEKARSLADRLAVLPHPTADQEEWYDRITDYMEAYEEVHYPM